METNKITKLLKAFKQIAPVLPSLKMPQLQSIKPTTDIKLPGIKSTTKKNPVKIAEQTKNKDFKDIKIKEAQESLKINKSTGQWTLESLEKGCGSDFKSCVKDVKAQGKPEDSAYAICTESVKKDEDKEIDKGIEEEKEHAHVLKQIAEDAKNGKLKGIEHYLKDIAKDHISKIRNYYSKLEEMEKEALNKALEIKQSLTEPHETHKYELHNNGKKIKDVIVHSHVLGGKKLHWIKDDEKLSSLERAAILKMHHSKLAGNTPKV